MGRLDMIVDMTGKTNLLAMNEENISNIIDEMNRNSDQLDAIANNLNIIARGTLTGTWDGTANHGVSLVQNHGFSTPPIFVAQFTRSDQPGIYYPVPQWFYDSSGNFQGRAYAYTDATNINLSFLSVVNGSGAVTFNFSWYILQQPAQVPTGN